LLEVGHVIKAEDGMDHGVAIPRNDTDGRFFRYILCPKHFGSGSERYVKPSRQGSHRLGTDVC